MVKIFTDSTSYIPKELREKYDITLLDITIILDGERYSETELPNSLFYQIVDKKNVVLEIEAPTVEYVTDLFKKETDNGNRVLGIFNSSKMTEIFSIATRAKNIVQKNTADAKIHLIDSQTFGMELGLAVIAAAKANAKGAWLENVAEAAYKVMQRSRYIFVPANLKNISKVGNMEKGQAFVGDLLQMRPILTLKNGEIDALEITRKQKNGIEKIIDIMDDDARLFGLSNIIIAHINAEGKAEELKQRLSSKVEEEILISSIGASVGYYIGPGTLGIIYQTEDVHPSNENVKIPRAIV